MVSEQLFSGWNRLVDQVINAAWEFGHLLNAFQEDTETSIVSQCIKCGAYACVDGDEAFGQALTASCAVVIQ